MEHVGNRRFGFKDYTKEIEVAATNGGSVLQVIENPVDPPLVSIEIPHQCDDVVNWSPIMEFS